MLGTFDNNPMYGLNVSSKLFDGVNRYVRITDIDDDTHDLVSNDICSPSSFTKNYLLSEGDLLFARTGASVGKTYLYNSIHGLQYFAGYLIKFHFKDNLVAKYVFYSTQTTRYKNWVNVFSKRSGQPGINSEEYSKFEIYLPKSNELKKIVSFFELLERKIQIVDAKCEALKKYRKGLIQIGLKQVYYSGSFVRFSDLYVDINERNIDSFNQYTVGKEGLKPILESNYDLQNHKIFQPNCLLIGIGIEEIAVSVNDSGSVSPVYNVYKINDKDYLNYTRFFLKPILWRKKAFITRKSTRREYEIDTKELLRFNLPVPFDLQFDKVCNSIESLDILIQQLTNKLKQLNRVKSYLLKNMFI